MLFEKIISEGLAHNSYLIGDGNEAVVIDPRRDVDIYLEKTWSQGVTIKHVLETHRNEDYLVGSLAIKKQTGASIWHADSQLDYQYGKPVQDGQQIEVGRLKIEAIHTPGHTPQSYSYILYGYEGQPWMVFTGDALLAGYVRRVGFLFEDNIDELASKLYDSIFNKILPLGDGVILCPAHGAGSVCGGQIKDRNLTTVGIEKNLNPKLQVQNKDDFIAEVGQVMEKAPYFKTMEKENVKGPSPLTECCFPEALSADEFLTEVEKDDTVVIDTRMESDFAAAHIQDSISIWKQGLASFAGWFLPYEKDILIVSEGNDVTDEVKLLRRMGYDNIRGYLSGGMLKWHMAGNKSESINTVTVDKLCNILDSNTEKITILDVRSQEEIRENGEIADSINIHITQLPHNLARVPENQEVYIFCGSGLRSMIAASILKRADYNNINVVLGGLSGWSSTTCPIK